MVECNTTETHNIYPNLNNQQLFRLNKINEINNYFVAEVKERELISKMLSIYIASFKYFDKSLIVLSVTSSINSNGYCTTYRNRKCKFQSFIFNSYRNCEKMVKNKTK